MTTPCPSGVQQSLKALGKTIRAARLERNMPIEELATRASIDASTAHRLEEGDPTCSIGDAFTCLWMLNLPMWPDLNEQFLDQLRVLQGRLDLLEERGQKHHDFDDNF